ncbi:MAG TPA: hypothetical protein VG496_01270 [Myxococcales bacterium]|nr:hypothetical protein [Myxococcales bacterium]
MNTRLFAAAATLIAACASAPPRDALPSAPESAPTELAPSGVPTPPAAKLDARQPGSTFNAKVWVSWQDTAMDCEASARAMRQSNPQHAWEALRACIEIGRFNRGPFTQITLLTSFWEEELRTRPDAARIVGQVIANRGGDVDGDISRVQKVRMPVFTLGAAMKQPQVYKGRWVLLRARLFDIKMDDKSATAMLAETTMKPAEALRDSGDMYVSSSSGSGSSSYSGGGSGAYSTDRYGSGRGSYSYDGSRSYSGQSSYTSGFAKRFYENVVHPTGRQALGRLPEADPFLEPNKEFVFVARFDGDRPGSEPNSVMAQLTIVTYYSPGALLLE